MARKSKEQPEEGQLEIERRWPRLSDVLERYLAKTQDLSREPAIVQQKKVVEEGGKKRTVVIHKTLDGSRVRPLSEVVSPEEYDSYAEKVRGKEIDGIEVGEIYVRVKGDN